MLPGVQLLAPHVRRVAQVPEVVLDEPEHRVGDDVVVRVVGLGVDHHEAPARVHAEVRQREAAPARLRGDLLVGLGDRGRHPERGRVLDQAEQRGHQAASARACAPARRPRRARRSRDPGWRPGSGVRGGDSRRRPRGAPGRVRGSPAAKSPYLFPARPARRTAEAVTPWENPISRDHHPPVGDRTDGDRHTLRSADRPPGVAARAEPPPVSHLLARRRRRPRGRAADAADPGGGAGAEPALDDRRPGHAGALPAARRDRARPPAGLRARPGGGPLGAGAARAGAGRRREGAGAGPGGARQRRAGEPAERLPRRPGDRRRPPARRHPRGGPARHAGRRRAPAPPPPP